VPSEFWVTHDAWVRAGRGIGEVSDRLAEAVNEFCRVTGGQPFGSDDLGRGLLEGDALSGAVGFAQRRGALMRDLAVAVNLLRGMGVDLVDAAGWYAEADVTIPDALRGGPSPRPGRSNVVNEYRLPPAAALLPVTTPPASVVLQAMWLFEMVGVGCPWPDGDPGGVQSLGDAATVLGVVLGGAAESVADHAGRVTGTGYGTASEAFGVFARGVHGEHGLLASLSERCAELAAYCRCCADALLSARRCFLTSAIFVVGLMVALTALGPLLSTELEAVLSLIRLEGLALRVILRLIYEAAVGGVFSAGLDIVDQLFRTGDLDLNALGMAALHGAIAGGMMGGANAGLPALLRRGPATAGLAMVMESAGWKGTLSRFLSGGTVATVTMGVTSRLTGHDWDWRHSAEVGFGMAAIGLGGETAARLRTTSSSGISPGYGLSVRPEEVETVGAEITAPRQEPVQRPAGVGHPARRDLSATATERVPDPNDPASPESGPDHGTSGSGHSGSGMAAPMPADQATPSVPEQVARLSAAVREAAGPKSPEVLTTAGSPAHPATVDTPGTLDGSQQIFELGAGEQPFDGMTLTLIGRGNEQLIYRPVQYPETVVKFHYLYAKENFEHLSLQARRQVLEGDVSPLRSLVDDTTTQFVERLSLMRSIYGDAHSIPVQCTAINLPYPGRILRELGFDETVSLNGHYLLPTTVAVQPMVETAYGIDLSIGSRLPRGKLDVDAFIEVNRRWLDPDIDHPFDGDLIDRARPGNSISMLQAEALRDPALMVSVRDFIERTLEFVRVSRELPSLRSTGNLLFQKYENTWNYHLIDTLGRPREFNSVDLGIELLRKLKTEGTLTSTEKIRVTNSMETMACLNAMAKGVGARGRFRLPADLLPYPWAHFAADALP
jgi:hypothetical protein